MSSTVASQLTSSSLTTTSPPASGTSDATSTTFTPPALSSALPDPGSAGAGGQTGPDSGSSSSLYLYTFLATLVLLLAVSATIVFRSMILRRRQRAAILAAIADGTYVPPSPPSRANQAVFGEKPRMYEVFLDEEKTRSQKWAFLDPVSAILTDPRGTPLPTIQPTVSNTPAETNLSGGRMRRFLNLTMPGFLRWRHSRPSEAYSSSLESIQLDSHQSTLMQQCADAGPLQVAVLVAMPSAARPGSQFHIPSHPPSHRPSPSFSRDSARVTTRTFSVSSDDSLKHDKSTISRAGPFEWDVEVPVVEIGVVHVGVGSPPNEQTHEKK